MDGDMLRGIPAHLTLFYSKRTGDIKKFTTGITDLFKAFGKEEGEELSLVYDTLIIDYDENIMLNYKDYKILNNDVVSKKVTIEELEKENKELKEEQIRQNDEIVTNMVANTEVFEMVLSMMPMTMSVRSENTNDRGDIAMVEVYATLIIKGIKTIDDVPLIIRAQVEQRLKELEIQI